MFINTNMTIYSPWLLKSDSSNFVNSAELDKYSLSSDLAIETSARSAADVTLQNNINALSSTYSTITSLNSEISRATAAEAEIASDLSTESNTRNQSDTTLANSISAVSASLSTYATSASVTELTNSLSGYLKSSATNTASLLTGTGQRYYDVLSGDSATLSSTFTADILYFIVKD